MQGPKGPPGEAGPDGDQGLEVIFFHIASKSRTKLCVSEFEGFFFHGCKPESSLLSLPSSPPQGGPGAEGEPGAIGEPGLKVSDLTTASLSSESFVRFHMWKVISTQPTSVCPRR